VVDFGTATTFDVVDQDGAYIGGVIAPGVNLSLEALHMAAAALPHVDVARPARAIGTNTVACMQSGVYWGYVGLVEGIVREVRRERDRPMKVIATGGLASLFAQGTELFHSIEDDLTMHGLVLINDLQQGYPMSANRLIYLPLGGAGEIGMNCLCLRLWAEGQGAADPGRSGRGLSRHGHLARGRPDPARRRPGWQTSWTGWRRSSSLTRTKTTSARWPPCGRGWRRRSIAAASPPPSAG
jgi:hypothetical protein